MKNWWVVAALGAVLAVAAGLRFTGLREQGLVSSDAAMYARQARFFYGLPLPGLADLGVSSPETPREAVDRGRARARALVEAWNARAVDFYEKPSFGHAWAVAGVMTLTGEPADVAAPLTTAAADTAAVAVVFLIARHLMGAPAGLLAAALMAVSRYSTFYARSGMAESDSVLLLLVGLFLYLRWRPTGVLAPPRAFALGLVWGGAVLVQYRWLPAIVLFLIVEAALAWRGSAARRAGRLAAAGAGVAVVMVLAELPFYVMLLVSNLAETPLVGIHTPLTNLALVLLKNRNIFDTAPSLEFLPAFGFYLFANDGLIPLLALAVGAWFALREPGDHRVLLRYVAVHLALMLLHDMYVARSYAALVPVCFVLGACGLARLASLVPARRWALGAAVVAIVAVGAPRAGAVARCRSGIPDAAGALGQLATAPRAVFPNAELAYSAYRYYAPSIAAAAAHDWSDVARYAHGDYDWVVADLSPYDVRQGAGGQWHQIRARLQSGDSPAVIVPHMAGCWTNVMFEGHRPLAEAWDLWRRYGDDAPHDIEVYRLARNAGEPVKLHAP